MPERPNTPDTVKSEVGKENKYRALFHAAHYNIVAKRFRQALEPYMNPTDYEGPSTFEGNIKLTVRGVILNLTIDFAKRFQIDNPSFDAVKFLNACSPDPDLYPLGELWDE